MPMIATTIISSIRVKPCWTRFMDETPWETGWKKVDLPSHAGVMPGNWQPFVRVFGTSVDVLRHFEATGMAFRRQW
jgi:hypothetical protein